MTEFEKVPGKPRESLIVTASSNPSPLISDPRVYFSAERTLLSWLRTGIGIMAFGFVVARFGMFLRLMRPEEHLAVQSSLYSLYIGAFLIFTGSMAIFGGTVSFRKFSRTIPTKDIPPTSSLMIPIAISMTLALLGVLLLIQLLWSGK